MSYSPDPSLPYSEFIQACRAFKPSELIPAIAQVSANLSEPPYSRYVMHRMPPWGLAAAARDSILYGNERRSKIIDDNALLKLMNKFQITDDIDDNDIKSEHFILRTMTLHAYEQFPYQESIFEEVSRSYAWMVEGLPDVKTQVITEDSLADMFDGVPLREAIAATLVLQAGALQNGGLYKSDWFDQPNFAKLLDIYPRANIDKISARLITTPDAFRNAFEANSIGRAKAARFSYNPLMATPFIDMGNGEPIAPATRLILRTITPGGLYYTGLGRHGEAFTRDLGSLFEHYIGRQLRLIKNADIQPEIVFNEGGNQKSVDWIVIMPNLVILVEVKSSRLGPKARASTESLMSSLQRTLSHAQTQLARTVDHLSNKHTSFSHIPTDRPMLGMIVTAEPFYTGTAHLVEQKIAVIPGGEMADVPVTVASAREVERLVTHGENAEQLLLAELDKFRSTGVGVSLRNIKGHAQNPILLNAWDTYPRPRREKLGDG